MTEPSDSVSTSGQRRAWFLRGVRAAFSIPGLVLVTAHIGFAGLARESGFTLAESVFMVAFIWALPGNVVLVGAIGGGSSILAAALAVTLSSIRLMPMVVAIVPEMRNPRTPRWVLYALSHCVAITSWVLAMQRLPSVPREYRTSYYAGLGPTLIAMNAMVVAVFYLVAGELPSAISAALLLLTPIYFLTSLWGSAREKAGYVAMVLGLGLGPLFHMLLPGYELLAAGLIGGGIAYAFHRMRRGSPSS